MRAIGRALRVAAAAVVLVALIGAVPLASRGRPVHRPAACSNAGCRCGSHAPGVPCCCVPDGPGPRLAGRGCQGQPDADAAAPVANRLAVLPVVLVSTPPAFSPCRGRLRPLRSRPFRLEPPEPVPRAGA